MSIMAALFRWARGAAVGSALALTPKTRFLAAPQPW